MGLLKVRHKGSFSKTEQFFNHALKRDYMNILNRYGEEGVAILSAATPVGTGKTAESWNFGIEEGKGSVTIYWTNSNENQGANIVLLLMYGHGLQNGSYVQGENFVNPAIAPVFREMANECWKEVTR